MENYGGSAWFNQPWSWFLVQQGRQHGGSYYWLGLEAMYQLTFCQKFQLFLSLTGSSGAEYMVYYSTFSVGPSSSSYQLTVSGYSSSNTGYSDPMAYHNGWPFSTYDKYANGYNCPANNQGGWWFTDCFITCLTCSSPSTNQGALVLSYASMILIAV